VGPETPADHVPSPRQKVEAEALVPLFKFVTGKLPVTLVAKLTKVVDVVPVPPLAMAKVPAKVTAPELAALGVKPVVPVLKVVTPEEIAPI
jgi:hypothetical protein